jgi:hypothetical protein
MMHIPTQRSPTHPGEMFSSDRLETSNIVWARTLRTKPMAQMPNLGRFSGSPLPCCTWLRLYRLQGCGVIGDRLFKFGFCKSGL